MERSQLILMPVEELQDMIIRSVKSCLKYPASVQKVNDRLLTEIQAAAFLDIPPTTLQLLIEKEEIPIRSKGRNGCYFSQQDLAVWCKANLQTRAPNGKFNSNSGAA